MPLFLRQFVRFAGVGGIGFVVDGGILLLLVDYGVNPFLARLVSFPFAAVATWWFNRMWTFRGKGGYGTRREFTSYLAVQLTGAVVNYGIYSLVLAMIGTTLLATGTAFCLGSACGFLLNFLGARQLVFR